MMNSSPIRAIRRKKSLLSEIKVLVVGAPHVGKSGFFVVAFNVN